MKMKMKIKHRSYRYDINGPNSRGKYSSKYKYDISITDDDAYMY